MKKFINKILNVPKLILTLWIMLWIILAILLVMKFCFNMWYPIVINNEWFINMCNYIDDNRWISLILMGTFYVLNINILFLVGTGNKFYNKWYWILLGTSISILMFYLKMLSNILGLISEIVVLVIIPIIINIKVKKFRNIIYNILLPLLNYALLNLWQFTMLVVRDADGLVLSNLPTLLGLALQLDYYIFTIITWIGVSYMGLWGAGWFWSKDITILKAEKEKELAKAKPNKKKIESLDIKIAELEKEGK